MSSKSHLGVMRSEDTERTTSSQKKAMPRNAWRGKPNGTPPSIWPCTDEPPMECSSNALTGRKDPHPRGSTWGECGSHKSMTRWMVGPWANAHMPSSDWAIITCAPALKPLRNMKTRKVGGACHVFPKLGQSSLFSLFLAHRRDVPLHYKRVVPWSEKGLWITPPPSPNTHTITRLNPWAVTHEL
jgi:hypothetical protein